MRTDHSFLLHTITFSSKILFLESIFPNSLTFWKGKNLIVIKSKEEKKEFNT